MSFTDEQLMTGFFIGQDMADEDKNYGSYASVNFSGIVEWIPFILVMIGVLSFYLFFVH